MLIFIFLARVVATNPDNFQKVQESLKGKPGVKILVVGAPGVGKSALVVRFLTKRYIGEYDHQSDTRYKNEVLVDGKHH